VKQNNDERERWERAIAAADTWRDPSRPRGPKPTGNLMPLAALFDRLDSDVLPPFVNKLLADLFERHKLKATTTRTPRYQFSDAEMNEQKYLDCTVDFRRQPNVRHGPITKAEMNAAVKVLQQRAKAEKRGHREFDGKKAATQLRQEQLEDFCNQQGLDRDLFERVLNRKQGSVNRRWIKPNSTRRQRPR
jgi:hypothetical protein